MNRGWGLKEPHPPRWREAHSLLCGEGTVCGCLVAAESEAWHAPGVVCGNAAALRQQFHEPVFFQECSKIGVGQQMVT
jgi:hypothetical protein